MDSSFLTSSLLTVVDVGLALYAAVMFFKMLIQFGLPNHPSQFSVFIASFCILFYFGSKAGVDLGLLPPVFWDQWSSLPMAIIGATLLIQTVMMVGKFSPIQQKVISRIPVITAIMCVFFFPGYTGFLCTIMIFLGVGFLSVSVGKSRFQKRIYYKMSFFFLLFLILVQGLQFYWVYLLAQFPLILSLFYFFLFENSVAIKALIEKSHAPSEGYAE